MVAILLLGDRGVVADTVITPQRDRAFDELVPRLATRLTDDNGTAEGWMRALGIPSLDSSLSIEAYVGFCEAEVRLSALGRLKGVIVLTEPRVVGEDGEGVGMAVKQ
jgi:hypothetical protein